MRWADNDLFPGLRHLQFDLEHIAGVLLERRLLDPFAGDTSQRQEDNECNLKG